MFILVSNNQLVFFGLFFFVFSLIASNIINGFAHYQSTSNNKNVKLFNKCVFLFVSVSSSVFFVYFGMFPVCKCLCVTAGYVFVVMFSKCNSVSTFVNEQLFFGKFSITFAAAALRPVLPAQSKVHCLIDLLLLLIWGA